MPLKVLVFESDPAFAGELRTELSRLGPNVQIVDDGNVGLAAAVSDRPDLILLSIELPRMNGFSVCNKLKKDPSLKDVPLIIMSSESSDETFEQHKKLRTRAEDYVHKPIAFGELLEHIRSYVQLEGRDDSNGAVDDGIVIDDDIELEEVEEADFLDSNGASGGFDAEVEAFADSAFDHLLDETRGPSATLVEETAGFTAHAGSSLQSAPNFEADAAEELAPTTEFAAVDFESPFPQNAGSSSSRPRGSSHPPHPLFDPETERMALRKETERQAAEVARLTDALASARSEVQRLQDVALDDEGSSDATVLMQRELDELRSKLAAVAPAKTGGVSSRDFLDLREALNRKDKEILALRDQISRKEKELLDASDVGLAVEREKADLDDRVALLQRDLQSARAAVETAKADKEQAAKRAEDWRSRGEKLKVELEAKAADLASFQARQDKELAERDARIRERDLELAERNERVTALGEQHRVDLAAAEERSRGLLAEAQRAADEQLQATVSEIERSRDELLSRAYEQAASERASAVATRETELTMLHEQRVAELERAHADMQERWRDELGRSQRDVEAARVRLEQREEELERQRTQELEAQRSELDRRRDAELAEADRRSSDDRAARENRHADQRRDYLAQLAEASSELAQRTEEREALASEASELRRSLAVSEALARETQADLVSSRERFAATSQKLDVAAARWEQSKSSLERAKDALAAAIVQIEDAEARGLE